LRALSVAEEIMKTTRFKVIALAVSAVVVVGIDGISTGGEPKSVAVPAGARDILNDASYWRWHVTMTPPTIENDGKITRMKRAYVNYHHYGDQLVSAAPKQGWAGADFDDSEWPRGRWDWSRAVALSRWSTQVLRLRGKFAVAAPGSAGKLYLSFSYRGGVRVLLNGKELKRRHLSAGELKADAVAQAYAVDAFVDSKGNPIPGTRARRKYSAARKKELAARAARRERRFAPMELPGKLLRKGVNVLAIEVRRAHYHPSAGKWFTKSWVKRGAAWKTISVSKLKLQLAGSGVAENLSRPAEVQLWNHDINDRSCISEYGDPNEAIRPVRMTGAKNGTFFGQVMLGSSQALSGIKVEPGALKAEKSPSTPSTSSGSGEIPAKNLDVLYGKLDMAPYGKTPWHLGLRAEPPARVAVSKAGRGAVLPITLRVRVPKDAAPGLYQGTAGVSANGKSFKVPIEVRVADWALPDSRDFRTYIGIYQSPTSVALQYKVKLWSEEHWKLMEKSFELLGRVGNKMVNIPVVDETQFGNPEGMIYFVKKKDSSRDYDFTQFDRYLKLAIKHCGKQDYVCLQIWHAGGWKARAANNKCTVQVLDEKTGKRSSVQVPLWGTPQAEAFWKPFFAKLQERLVKLGMSKAMTVGILSDSTAPPVVFKTMAAAWPGGVPRWHRGCHVGNGTRSGKPYGVGAGNVVTLHEHCYGMSMVKPDVKPLPALHAFRGRPGTAYFRVSSHLVTSTQLSARTMVERGLWCGKQGIGRICLDYWPVLKGKRGARDIYNRYPHSSCAQREPSLKWMTSPGKQGAESNKRFELFVLGLQEAEAMMVISKGAASGARVGAELTAKCEKLLRERLTFCHARDVKRWNHPYYNTNHTGWRDLNKRTFDLAGEVAKKLGKQ
jgi:Glycoside hydrolase 123, catalytic domain